MASTINLISSEEGEPVAKHTPITCKKAGVTGGTEPAATRRDAAGSPCGGERFYQLRKEDDPPLGWTLSFVEMLEPVATVTHVCLSTFGHAREQLFELRRRLEDMCPLLEEVRACTARTAAAAC
jgi:hypothetical protein